jgi:hypothetical protein
MERLLISLAVLIVITIGALVLRMALRAGRPDLRMDNEFEDEDTDLLIGPLRRPAASPIDRSAQTLDITPQPAAGRDRTAPEHRP